MGAAGNSFFSKNITRLFFIFVIQGIGAALGFALQIFIARQLAVEEFGKFNIYLNISIILAMIISFGSTETVLRSVSTSNINSALCSQILKHTICFCIINWLVAVVFSMFAAAVFFDYFIEGWSWYVLLLVTLLGLFQALITVFQNFDRALGNALRSMVPNFLLKSLFVGAGLYISLWYLSDLDVGNVIEVYLVALAGLLLFFISFVHKHLFFYEKFSLNFNYILSLKNNYQYFINAISQTLLKNIDLILIGVFLNSFEAGIYAVASRINMVIVFGLASLNILYSPIVAKLFSERKTLELNNSLKVANKVVFLFSAILFALIVFKGNWVLSLFGAEFSGGYTVLVLLGLVNLVEAFFGITGSVLNMTGNQHIFNKILYLVLIIYLLLSPLAIMWWGGEGLASVVLIVTFIKNFKQWKYIYFKLTIRSGVFSDLYYLIRG